VILRNNKKSLYINLFSSPQKLTSSRPYSGLRANNPKVLNYYRPMCTQPKNDLEPNQKPTQLLAMTNQQQFFSLTTIADQYIKNVLLSFHTTATYIRAGFEELLSNLTFGDEVTTCDIPHLTNSNCKTILRTDDAFDTLKIKKNDGSLKGYEITTNQTCNNEVYKIQIFERDKSGLVGTREDDKQTKIIQVGNENYKNGVKKSEQTSTLQTGEIASKSKVQLRQVDKTIQHDKLKIDTATQQDTIATPIVEVKPRVEAYNPSNFNYYWPLDPDHELNVKEYLEQIKIRRDQSDIFRKSPSSSIKRVFSGAQETKTDLLNPKKTKWKKSHLDNINITKLFQSQSIQEYNTKIKNKEVFSEMISSQLIKRTPKAPVLTPLSQMHSGVGKSNLTNDANEWTTVGSKKLEKKFESIYEPTSTLWYPTNLPNTSVQDKLETTPQTNHTIQLTIKITKAKEDTKKINRARVLIAILQAMQNVFPDTYIAPKVIDKKYQPFLNVDMIKTTDEILNMYFEDAEEMQSGSLLSRVYIKCNNALADYKKKFDI
jgi:hypothetical protein